MVLPRRIGLLSIVASLLFGIGGTPSIAAAPIPMVLATVATSSPRVRLVEGQLDEEHPGWFYELSTRAAGECGLDMSLAFMPWARALELVKRGSAAGAFNSSFKPDRAEYGVYPMKHGKLDEDRASKRYAYFVYTRRDTTDLSLVRNAELRARSIVTERKASIIPTLEKKGAKISEAGSYVTMLRMVAKGRVQGAVGIDHNLDPILDRRPDLAALVQKSRVPVEKKVGYVMFSKRFYAAHREAAECFWNRSAELKRGRLVQDHAGDLRLSGKGSSVYAAAPGPYRDAAAAGLPTR